MAGRQARRMKAMALACKLFALVLLLLALVITVMWIVVSGVWLGLVFLIGMAVVSFVLYAMGAAIQASALEYETNLRVLDRLDSLGLDTLTREGDAWKELLPPSSVPEPCADFQDEVSDAAVQDVAMDSLAVEVGYEREAAPVFMNALDWERSQQTWEQERFFDRYDGAGVLSEGVDERSQSVLGGYRPAESAEDALPAYVGRHARSN